MMAQYGNLNPKIVARIVPLRPQGTNSTFFTECCGTAICDYETICPKCKRKVIGWEAVSSHERHHIRWRQATAHWGNK